MPYTFLLLYGGGILLGLLSPLWFGKLFFPVKKIRKGSRWLDASEVDLSEAPKNIAELRLHRQLGDKIVVPHWLDSFTKDLQRKILFSLVYGGLTVGVLNILVVLVNENDKNAYSFKENTIVQLGKLEIDSTDRKMIITQMNNLTNQETTLWNNIIRNWPVPLFLVFALVQIFIYCKLMHEQADKYNSIIKKAAPK